MDAGNYEKDTAPSAKYGTDLRQQSNRSGRGLRTKGKPTLDRSESGISGDFDQLGGNDESLSYSMPASKLKGANQNEGERSSKKRF